MNKKEILNIVNEPSKHIHIVKIDGHDEIVYSSKFVELLELISTMLTKDEVVDMLTDLQAEIVKIEVAKENTEIRAGECCMKGACIDLIQDKINKLKEQT